MATVTDDELFERTVRSLIGGTMGPPKYIYRGMVSGLVLDIAKRHFHDADLAKLAADLEKFDGLVTQLETALRKRIEEH